MNSPSILLLRIYWTKKFPAKNWIKLHPYTVRLIIKFPKKLQNYNTQYSHVVPHHSTDWAIPGLTSEIGRDLVLFRMYGRSLKLIFTVEIWAIASNLLKYI